MHISEKKSKIKSTIKYNPGLYVVSTPIGNLEDITFRALEVFKNSDIIFCEDTRRSLKLMNYYNINKKLFAYHKFNEKKLTYKIVDEIKTGKVISLISDAGTPCISDPGREVIQECLKSGIKVYPIPGPSAITSALSVSGMDGKFFFYGFLPKKNKEIERDLNNLTKINASIIFFVAPQKVKNFINLIKKYFSNKEIFIAREMTKIHENYIKTNISNLNESDILDKGEITVILSNFQSEKHDGNQINEKLIEKIKFLLTKFSSKDVADYISKDKGISKNEIYKICLNLKK